MTWRHAIASATDKFLDWNAITNDVALSCPRRRWRIASGAGEGRPVRRDRRSSGMTEPWPAKMISRSGLRCLSCFFQIGVPQGHVRKIVLQPLSHVLLLLEVFLENIGGLGVTNGAS